MDEIQPEDLLYVNLRGLEGGLKLLFNNFFRCLESLDVSPVLEVNQWCHLGEELHTVPLPVPVDNH